MTDTTSGARGGVGIRLFVQGGEVVRRTFDQVGDSGKKMWAQIALGEKSVNPAFRAISRGANEVGEGISGLAAKTGGLGRSLDAFGASGVAFAAVLGAVSVAVVQAKDAMAFADEIDDAAQKLNIGTDALQEYRYAMTAVGGSAEDADAAIGKFTKTLGAAQSGLSPRAMKPFTALGFTREQIQSFDSGEDALVEVARRVADLSKESERAAVAEKLGLGPMLPLLREGADGMEDLLQKAHDLGLVMDEELVAKGAAANQRLEEISATIRIEMAEAFVGLSDEVIGFTENMLDALQALNRFIGRYNDWKLRAQLTGDAPTQTEAGVGALGPGGTLTAFVSNRIRRGWRWVTGQQPSPEAVDHAVAMYNQAREELPGDDPSGRDGNRTESPADRASRGRADRTAERLEREGERALERLQREGRRAEADAVRARYAGETADERLALARETARLARDERDAQRGALLEELKRTGVLDEATQAQIDQLSALDAEADALNDRAMVEAHRKDLAEEALRRDQAREDDALALLDIEAQLATTRQEQYAIERRILLLRQAAERRALAKQLEDDVRDGKTSQAEADARLGSADYRNRLSLQLFDENERERAKAEFRSFGHEVVDAIKEKRIGEWIADEMQARLMDMALNGLFDFLFSRGPNGQAYGPSSGGNSAVGNIISTVLSAMFQGQGPGRAGGGPLWPGFSHAMVETGRPELMLIGGNGHVTDAVATARMLRESMDIEGGGAYAAGGRMIVEHHHNWDLRGAVMTEDLLQQMDLKAAAAEGRAVKSSLDLARRGAGARQQSLHRLGK